MERRNLSLWQAGRRRLSPMAANGGRKEYRERQSAAPGRNTVVQVLRDKLRGRAGQPLIISHRDCLSHCKGFQGNMKMKNNFVATVVVGVAVLNPVARAQQP